VDGLGIDGQLLADRLFTEFGANPVLISQKQNPDVHRFASIEAWILQPGEQHRPLGF
jgi:hypothetical protein